MDKKELTYKFEIQEWIDKQITALRQQDTKK